MISIIAAMARNRVIGRDNELPWHLPADLAHFKRKTTGRTVIMGRRTFESIVGRLGTPLPNRANCVITRDETFVRRVRAARSPSVRIFHSLEEAVSDYLPEGDRWHEEAFAIGGAHIFAQALQAAHRLYLTVLDREYEGDTYFPEVDWDEWHLESSTKGPTDEDNPVPHRYLIYERPGRDLPEPR